MADLFTKRKYPRLFFDLNVQDTDWLAAARLKKIVDEGGPKAEEAARELIRMEESKLVYWKDLKK